ncbi:hypothetical protein J3R82DRAFT_8658 [Butyriboletus roseoflavus]|nr:hypothetical protein J3R82DRAFT_8658 [Butyriboletus roseoflavus]
MLPTAIAEQQAKLGVSAGDSKAQRLKRLQARFRDRGGAFVPSNLNPLVDILLARAVSGESPSKARPKNVAGRRLSSSKVRQASPTHKTGATTITEESQAVAGSSKSKPPASRKRKAKAVEPEADTATKPAPNRRSKPAKGKKNAPGSDTEQTPPDTTIKSKSTSKGKGRPRHAAPSTSDGNQKMKTKPQAKAKSNRARDVVEVLVSDDDQTLVDVPHKAKSNPKRNTRYEDDDETDDDVPIVRKRAILRVDDSKASNSKTATRVNTERIASTESSRKRTLEDGEEKSQGDKHPKTEARKRLVLHDEGEDDNDVTSPPAKKGKVASSTSAKPQNAAELTPHTIKEEKPKVTGKRKGKSRAEHQDIVKPVNKDDDERPPERASKPKKRKKEDNYDDRPRKVVKFSDTGHKHKSEAKSSVKDEPNGPRLKLAIEAPSRTKTLKGPPREVLERIKASAVRHLRCADSEPDELDCLS